MKTTAMLLCAAVFLVAGCRVGGDDSGAVTRTAAASACSDGAIRWSGVGDKRLVAVSRPVEAGEKGETSGEGPSADRLFASLGEHLGWEADTLARPGRSSAAAWAVRSVEASFTADCSGTPVHGSVSSWHGSFGASLRCGVDPSDEGGGEAWIAEAYALTCGKAGRSG